MDHAVTHNFIEQICLCLGSFKKEKYPTLTFVIKTDSLHYIQEWSYFYRSRHRHRLQNVKV